LPANFYVFRLSDMGDLFQIFAGYVSRFLGSIWALVVVVAITLVTGWIFGFSERWEAGYSLGLTVTTLIFVIFLQNSQNHSDRATHLKLDELIKGSKRARNEIAAVETKPASDLDALQQAKADIERIETEK